MVIIGFYVIATNLDFVLEQITSRYAYCFEITHFSPETPIPSLQDSFVIDNVCMNFQGLTYHFLSSTQGGTTSFITAPKAGITVSFLESYSIGLKLDWHCRPVVSFFCRFRERSQVLRIYDEIYQLITLTVISSLAKHKFYTTFMMYRQ